MVSKDYIIHHCRVHRRRTDPILRRKILNDEGRCGLAIIGITIDADLIIKDGIDSRCSAKAFLTWQGVNSGLM